MRRFIAILFISLMPLTVFGQSAQKQQGYFNPDISVIIDGFYHNDSSSEGISHILEEVSGFGHECSGEHHHGPDKGFNLNHMELYLSAVADPYFKGWGIIGVEEEGAELEEAVIQTTALPHGLQLKAGKFFSDFGRINPQHAHSWDFTDQPLIYRLALGTHGLNDKGAQLSWLAPADFYLLAGLEGFQGNNETMFNYLANEHAGHKAGPRLGVGWLKIAPNLTDRHELQFGLFSGRGGHQEAHDGNSDETFDHWLDGQSAFWGTDLVYKYDSFQAFGVGDLVMQCEYLIRRKDLRVSDNDMVNNPAAPAIGLRKTERQDGFYIQTLYGFAPRWRAGLRWENIGLINLVRLPDGSKSSPGDTARLSVMADWTLSEFSRLRLQAARGSYDTDGGIERVSEIYLQLQISLGTHGAHKF